MHFLINQCKICLTLISWGDIGVFIMRNLSKGIAGKLPISRQEEPVQKPAGA